ncbi:hypothetical protein PLICRDRAFT_117059 [Plicaturopsis crispa FD-325 SS-3]|uniref:FAD/NAD(P)-binding domain-containing protein n=1 Tax=Plicaturopsis crispa FD-325 SS-3 TaxID=944288 RepID=A0A0C9SL60_PLICR|nr:hypothetical protein PLICRDRAFT_117059 [Plicaturopsis crispa FD-325 SS-3]
MNTAMENTPAPAQDSTKTVVVLGASTGGYRAAHLIAEGLPEGWRVIVIERNSHNNHLYILPRLGVLPGHEYKAFIPYTNIFSPSSTSNSALNDPTRPHLKLHATITSLTPHTVTLSRAFPEHGIPEREVRFEYAVYALGARLPAPIDLWGAPPACEGFKEALTGHAKHPYGGTKPEGIAWLQKHQAAVQAARSVLVVGGGALGVQYATDIAAVYPSKRVTLLHSRHRLLPRFDEAMHAEILQAMEELGVEVILGERLDMDSVSAASAHTTSANTTSALDVDSAPVNASRVVRTVTGRELAADLLLMCTGQLPNTDFLRDMDPRTVDPRDGMAHVLRTMQLGVLREEEVAETDAEQTTPYPHIFAIGDAADAFGALNAGHTAYWQAEVAARNLVRLDTEEDTQGKEEAAKNTRDDANADPSLEHYTPGAPAIKLSLGLTKSLYQIDGAVGTRDDGVPDLRAELTWAFYGFGGVSDEDMHL